MYGAAVAVISTSVLFVVVIVVVVVVVAVVVVVVVVVAVVVIVVVVVVVIPCWYTPEADQNSAFASPLPRHAAFARGPSGATQGPHRGHTGATWKNV